LVNHHGGTHHLLSGSIAGHDVELQNLSLPESLGLLAILEIWSLKHGKFRWFIATNGGKKHWELLRDTFVLHYRCFVFGLKVFLRQETMVFTGYLEVGGEKWGLSSKSLG
jgi:hypothetical protein